MDVQVIVGVCLVALLVLWIFSKNRKGPPGPWGLPIVGYLPFLGKEPYLELQRLGKKYGGIFSLNLGSQYVIVITKYQAIKEALVQEALLGRPPEFAFEINEVSIKTGAFLEAPWKEQRRFALHSLRDLGFGKTKMEGHIQEEIDELLKYFEQNIGKPFSVRQFISPSMSNNIGALVFGRRFKYEDPVRQMLTISVNERAKAASQANWILFFPWLKKFLTAFSIGKDKYASRIQQECRDFIMEEIEEHERTLNPENIRDFIDGYLLEMKKRTNEPAFNKFVLQDLVQGFFSAGSETVRLSTEWLIIAMADHQDVQRRVQAEIDDVIAGERPPIWQDHMKMPYTYAVIMEMQRWKTLVPMNVTRYTLADTEVNGYFIPKHTQVMANLWAVHHDKDCWGEDADEFRPERFLSEDGKSFKKRDELIPFSIGKRACPGEPLAKIEVFLYFVSILQKFNIRFPDGKVANYDADLGIGLVPKDQDVILTKRF